MDKKTLPLIIGLILIILFYFPILEFLGIMESAPSQQEQPGGGDTTTSLTPEQVYSPYDETARTLPDQTPASPVLTTDSALSPADYIVPDTIIVRTNVYEVILTSFGGGPISLKLNKYSYRNGDPIQMLALAEYATPEVSFAGGTFSTSRVAFQCDQAPGEYDATRSPLELTYRYHREGGEIIKKYRFEPDSYDFGLELTVNNPGRLGFERRYSMDWNTPLNITEPQAESDYMAMEAVAMQGGQRETLDDFDDGRLNQVLDGATVWAGVRSMYFAAVLIPNNRPAEAAHARGFKNDIIVDEEGSIEMRRITAGLEMEFASVETFTDSFTVFVGPLDYFIMSSYGAGLEDILGIGTMPFVGWIIKPFAIGIIWLLPRMYAVLPNYGLVIILFSLLIKLVTLPLSMKSFKSMNAMKELAPKVEELKKKHKKNPQALNTEMMKMYKAHGVNPISGCLPMIPQMPLLFALFAVFRQTILFRDAPFIWFIDDLSRGATSFTDPYIILVIIMVGAQFISQKLTMPSTQQNKALLYVMPLFMGWIFHSFASGLVLYWVCFSVFSLLDYVLFKRKKNAQVKTT